MSYNPGVIPASSIVNLPTLQPDMIRTTLTAGIGVLGHDSTAILITVLEELESQGKLDFWLLKNRELTEFWNSYQEKKRRRALYDRAVAKMRAEFTEEELAILKIRLPSSEEMI